MAEQWIDWHPKVGDIKPAGYRFWSRLTGCWVIGAKQGLSVSTRDAENNKYQVPAPVATTAEDRPHWIDPRCKFRWGDRVKDAHGRVLFVINPQDTTNRGFVVVATRLSAAVPYAVYSLSNLSISLRCQDDLELFPEDLPQHFDDRLLDADQPQEQPKIARVPREIWVNVYPHTPLRHGGTHDTQDEANLHASSDRVECVHFREVL